MPGFLTDSVKWNFTKVCRPGCLHDSLHERLHDRSHECPPGGSRLVSHRPHRQAHCPLCSHRRARHDEGKDRRGPLAIKPRCCDCQKFIAGSLRIPHSLVADPSQSSGGSLTVSSRIHCCLPRCSASSSHARHVTNLLKRDYCMALMKSPGWRLAHYGRLSAKPSTLPVARPPRSVLHPFARAVSARTIEAACGRAWRLWLLLAAA